MEKVIARMIFEILGRPSEHVKETLNTLVVKMGSEEGVKIIDKTYHDPIKVEGSKTMFTAFAEVELEFESMSKLFGILFLYFPSNLEILSPRNLKIGNEELNDLGNSLISRIHQYDAITKKLLNEQKIIFKRLKEEGIDLKKLFPNNEEKGGQSKSNGSKK